MKKLLSLIFLTTSLIFLNNCATEQALNQPIKKDLSVFDLGTDRELVLLEIGSPAETLEEDGQKVDLFSFVQGYGKGTRMARATGHLTAEIATLGLWGIIGTPIEQEFNGTVLGYKIYYDENDKVSKAEKLVEKDNN